MTKIPTKTIKQEHYIISGLAFIGNVGGILGIFIGFSILDATGWISSVIQSMHKRMMQKRVVHLDKQLNLPLTTKWPQFT